MIALSQPLQSNVAEPASHVEVSAEMLALRSHAVLFLLPSKGASGGAQMIVRQALGLQYFGLPVKIAVPDSCFESVSRSHPEAADLLEAFPDHDEHTLMIRAAQCTFVIATNYKSVKLLETVLRGRPGIVPMYYVQDYEPWFFGTHDPRHAEALGSYTLLKGVTLFSYSSWVIELLRKKHEVGVEKIEACLDRGLFNTFSNEPSRSGEAVRIAQ